MKTARLLALLFVAPCLATACYGASDDAVSAPRWNQAAAAHYLDSRETWWQSWDAAKRDHATVCVSCHTVVPYALSRSSLRGSLGEEAPTEQEQVMLNNVLRRVTMWNEVQPFYPNSKSWSHAGDGLASYRIGAERSHPLDLRPTEEPSDRHYAAAPLTTCGPCRSSPASRPARGTGKTST